MNQVAEERENLAELTNALRVFLGVLERRKWFAIGVLLATVGATFLWTTRQPPVYKATATVIIEKRSPAVLSRVQEVIELGTSDYWSIKEYLQTQLEILKSRRLAKRVVDKLGLALDERFLGLAQADPPLSEGEKRRKMAELDAVGILLSRIQVEPRLDSQVVLVSLESSDAHMAQELANALVTEYRDQNLEYKKRVVTEAISELREMLVRLRREKEEAEARVLEFERRHAMGSLVNRKEMVGERLAKLSSQYIDSSIAVADAETSPLRQRLAGQIVDLETLLKSRDFSRVAHPTLVESASMNSLKHRLVEIENEIRALNARYGPKHHLMQAAYSQRKLVQHTLQREGRILLEAELLRLQDRLEDENGKLKKAIDMESEIRTRLEEAKESEAALTRLELDYRPLVKRRDEAAVRHDEVKSRYSETSLSAQIETNNIRVQDLAPLPKVPVRPNKKLNLLIGLLLGLLMGVGAAFFVESLDSTLKTREDIESIPGVTFLGMLPAIGELEQPDAEGTVDQPELFVRHQPKSSASEQIRTVKTNLFFSRPGGRARQFLVTSPGPKEGKTTVAANLAAATALSGSRAILVDTDMRRPRVHKLLGIPRRPGITEYYVGNRSILDFVRPTSVSGMDVLTCGAISPNPMEIIESGRFRKMLAELAETYDVIFMDSPPLLAVADAKIICSLLDAAVLVVRAGQTSKDALREAREMLDPVIGDNVGVVLNCFDVEKHSYRYYYYRSKRYGYYNYYAYEGTDPEDETTFGDDGEPDRSSRWAKQ